MTTEVDQQGYSSKKCFIVTPIGGDNTDIRRAAEGVIDAVVVPILTNHFGFLNSNITVAHRMPHPGSINKQVIQRILEDDLVIANLTGLNPNVMYELAIRHASRKPVITICENGTKLPFDIIEERTIFYANDMYGTVDLSNKLRVVIEDVLESNELPDNPIYRVIESNLIQKSDKFDDKDKIFISRMERLEEKLNNIGSNSISQLQTIVKVDRLFFVEVTGDLPESENDLGLKRATIGNNSSINSITFIRGVPPEKSKKGIKVITISVNDPKKEVNTLTLEIALMNILPKNLTIVSVVESAI
ncbi:hypothetical protein [Paenibacillus sp. GCM10012303]|uniref:hypothetical protein n=1 Tax=Paenibacillus sp. GCM10012303 TaxID=3317340 RepID=UPI00360CB0AC